MLLSLVRLNESMRELENLRTKPELTIAALLALIHAHKLHKTPGLLVFHSNFRAFVMIKDHFRLDREAISEYEVKVKELRKQADDNVSFFLDLQLCYTVLVFSWFTQSFRHYSMPDILYVFLVDQKKRRNTSTERLNKIQQAFS